MQLTEKTLPIDNGMSLIKEEFQARRAGFDNATMRRAQQAKPHIAKIGGYWRVSPWKPATRDLYYAAHAYVARLNSLAKPIEGNHVHCDYQHTQHAIQAKQADHLQRDQCAQLAKKLEHGLRYGMGAGRLLQLLEQQVECEQQAAEETTLVETTPIEEK